MTTSLGIGTLILAAASLIAPAAIAQTAPPAPPRVHARVVQSSSASYLGIGVQDIDAERAHALKLREERGAEVTSITGDSPASKAGFKEGDVVLSFNGQRVEGGEQLSRMIRETPAGRQAKVEVWRNGSMQTLTPTVGARKAMSFSTSGDWPSVDVAIPPIPEFHFEMPSIDVPNIYVGGRSARLGIEGESIGQEAQLAEFFGVKEGVLVKAVTRSSAAERAGLKAGDVIVKVGESRVTSTREITAALRQISPRKTITVTVVRNRKEVPISVTLEERNTGDGSRAEVLAVHC